MPGPDLNVFMCSDAVVTATASAGRLSTHSPASEAALAADRGACHVPSQGICRATGLAVVHREFQGTCRSGCGDIALYKVALLNAQDACHHSTAPHRAKVFAVHEAATDSSQAAQASATASGAVGVSVGVDQQRSRRLELASLDGRCPRVMQLCRDSAQQLANGPIEPSRTRKHAAAALEATSTAALTAAVQMQTIAQADGSLSSLHVTAMCYATCLAVQEQGLQLQDRYTVSAEPIKLQHEAVARACAFVAKVLLQAQNRWSQHPELWHECWHVLAGMPSACLRRNGMVLDAPLWCRFAVGDYAVTWPDGPAPTQSVVHLPQVRNLPDILAVTSSTMPPHWSELAVQDQGVTSCDYLCTCKERVAVGHV